MTKRAFSLLGLILLFQAAFAAPHGDDIPLTSNAFIGKWYVALGSVIKDDGSVKTIDTEQEKMYYIFDVDGKGHLTRNSTNTPFTWALTDNGLAIRYHDGYSEKYTYATFFTPTSLSLSGKFDFYQTGHLCLVTLALYGPGGIFYQ